LGYGEDYSARYAFNAYAQHGLEFGRDLVHIAGPLARLIYPVAGNHHLLHTYLFASMMHVVFLVGLSAFAVRRDRCLSISSLIVICALFFFGLDCVVREVQIYGICLVLFLLDLEMPRSRLFVFPGILSGLSIFMKFNIGVTLAVEFLAYLGLAHLLHRESWRTTLLKGLTFLLPFVLTAVCSFSSVSSFWKWGVMSLDLAQGNSDAMTIVTKNSYVFLAVVVVCLTVLIAGASVRTEGKAKTLSWLILMIFPLFSEFKHGFVRADSYHVCLFFEFAAVVAASHLVFLSGRFSSALLVCTIVVGMCVPSVHYPSVYLQGKVERLWVQGVGRLAKVVEREKRQEEMNRAALAWKGLRPREIAAVGESTVEIASGPEIAALANTRLKWRPSPVFLYFLVRSPGLDRANSDHLESLDAAEYLIWSWHIIDQRHPFYEAPATHVSILNHYRFHSETMHRLLLRRASGPRFERHFLESVRAAWNEPIRVPESDSMVMADVRTGYTLCGRLLKVFYRVPPVFIRLDDGTEYRIVPSTAVHGLLVNYVPRHTAHFRSLLEYGRIDPECPPVSHFSIKCNSVVSYFADEIEIDFYELRHY